MIDSWVPARWDITVPAVADFDDFITWLPDGVTPAILTGYHAKQEFRRRFDDVVPLLTITDYDYLSFGEDGGDDAGKIIYAVPAVKMSLRGDVRPVDVVTSLELTSPAGKVYRAFDGTWTVTPEATK